MIQIAKLAGFNLEERKLMSPRQAEIKGLSKELVAKFTHRQETAPKLVRVDRAEAMRVFQQ